MSSDDVLVVDDDPVARRLIRATLDRVGVAVVEASDGAQALERMRADLPALVLMDVSMPVMDGFTACAGLRELPGGKRVPVVMITGLDDVESIEKAFRVGATDFITKPINWPILAHRVRYMLRATTALNQIEHNHRRLSNAQRIGDMGDWEWSLHRDHVVPSEHAWRILGREPVPAGLTGEEFADLAYAEDRERLQAACRNAIDTGCGFSIEHRIVRANGETRHVHQQVEVLERDQAGRVSALAGAIQDITARKSAEEHIRRLAYYDTLTGLPNRLLFTEHLNKAIAHAERNQRHVAIMFIDLDQFKRVNDTLGHVAGDELLKVVSSRLATSVRAQDAVSRACVDDPSNTIARLGGDEFIVMIGDLSGTTDAAASARRLIAALEQPVVVQGTELYVGASVGIAMYPYDGTDIDTLLMNADTAMYRAKDGARGGVQFYDRSMNARAFERLVLESNLRQALEREEFVLHYQPRIDVACGRVVGAEALIRWRHPERGIVSPDEFISLAEETSLIIPIGVWAIAEACRQMAEWRAAGLEPGPVAVNLAATHLREESLPGHVARMLQEYDLPRGSLEIEVTESVLLADPELSIQIASQLAALGVGLAIDDFGTGYSSLSYLKRLPVTALKIDQSFVRNLGTDPDNEAIITAIIAMAHTLKLKVVAEGVESLAQRAFLETRGCDEFQGFVFSRAIDAKAFAALLETQKDCELRAA